MTASPPAPADPFPGFEKLSELVYLYRPPPGPPAPFEADNTTTSHNRPRPPKLVLLAGWMGARAAHLAKYTAAYQALFPGTPVLLVRCFVHHFTPGLRRRGARALTGEIAPAVAVIRSLVDDGGGGGSNSHDDNNKSEDEEEEGGGKQTEKQKQKQPEILVHVFSNGGATILRHLYTLYSSNNSNNNITTTTTRSTAGGLPPRVTIFDSAPGRFHYARSVHAFTVGLPHARTPLLKYLLVHLAVRLLCAAYWVAQCVLGRLLSLSLDRTYAVHNDPPAAAHEEVRRTYIYSREDRMIDFRDVEAHAAEARRKGVVGGGGGGEEEGVRLERFQGTEHVAHVRGDAVRYWRVVKETWEGGRS